MISERSQVLLREVNDAHLGLMDAVSRAGPVFVSAGASSPNNALNWLGDDKTLAHVHAALERLTSARARLALSVRMDYAEAKR